MEKLKKKLYGLLVITCMLMLSINLNAQVKKEHAIFLYKFTKEVEWPVKPSKFVIGVLGAPAEYFLVKRLLSTRSDVEVIQCMTPADAEKCNIVYVTGQKSSLLEGVGAAVGQKKILVVSNVAGGKLPEQAVINFVTQNGVERFQMSKKRLVARGLRASTTLTGVAVLSN